MSKKKYIIDDEKLMSEWDWEENNKLGIDPKIITCGSRKDAWWKCVNGHKWIESIQTKNIRLQCPYCSGKRPIKGETDFATKSPTLMLEWNYDKNIIRPDEILPNSGKKVWWICEKGHEWEASPNNRTRGTGCPICSKEASTSFPEMAMFYYLEKLFKVESRKKIGGKEIDIYFPDLNFGIEYDGKFYHKDEKVIERDKKKTDFLKKYNINLMRIKEANYTQYEEKANTLFVKFDNKYEYLETAISTILNFISKQYNKSFNISVDIKKDRINILNLYKSLKRENSIFSKNPKLAQEWNYDKNENLLPEYFDYNSRHSVWWKCEKGHEWEASIYSRNNGNGCPYCANQKVLKGFNDLTTTAKDIVKEWNYQRNIESPESYVSKSDKKVWWICEKGHEWEAQIKNRMNGNSCPYCANKKVLVGFNDLKTWCKDNGMDFLINEFDYNKNPFDITTILPSSGKMIWWLCPNGHSYSTYLSHRTKMRTSCPYCSNKKLLSGYNDLATTHPHIAKEWDYDKNGDVKPSDVMAGSNIKKYWFICPNKHSYSATLLNRKKGRGCPECYKIKRKKK